MPPSPTHPRFRLNSWLRPGFAVSAFVIYAAALPPAAIALAAAIGLGLGGAPGAIYAAGPQAAPTAVAPTIGMLQQAMGKFTGLLTLGLWVEQGSWHLQPCLASVPLLPFGKQCGARPHPNPFRRDVDVSTTTATLARL